MDLPAIGSIVQDVDTQETEEWLQALHGVWQEVGPERTRFLLSRLSNAVQKWGVNWRDVHGGSSVNTIRTEQEPPFPGGVHAQIVEQQLAAVMRWNALVMVLRANHLHGELGGDIGSYAAAADLFEVGFNHFFRAQTEGFGGDLVYFQPHAAPGIYARAFLEGGLSEHDLRFYRREIEARRQGYQGLPAYPHPWLMPQFWQFPTGSMAPINAIHQARFLRYLEQRALVPEQGRKVWGIFGDDELDRPEALAALSLAARESMDNLIFVINCALQRPDGPLKGASHIVDELENLFAGSGWNVIKLLWGSDWDDLLICDCDERPPGVPEHSMADERPDHFRRGGHDMKKIYAAYHAASRHRGQPTVILAQTRKGYGMGMAGSGAMAMHAPEKFDEEALLTLRDRLRLPLSDAQCRGLAFYHPPADSLVMMHLALRRKALGGALPRRAGNARQYLVPPLAAYAGFAMHAAGKEMSSTMALMRLLGAMLKTPGVEHWVVPIVADDARASGLADWLRQVGLHAAQAQPHESEDIGAILFYRGAHGVQILEDGVSEAGAIASWTAAATSYSVHGLPMLPFYIHDSMLGFQRIGDLIWAAADQRARGFLVGTAAGRTSLGGEGLQHQDGSSHVFAATIPNCVSYDPAYAYELAVIIDEGMRRMLERSEDVFYYLTVTNEIQAQPSLPAMSDASLCEAILRGMYCLQPRERAQVRLLASGPMLTQAIGAAQLLLLHFNIDAEVWSVTSYSELARDGIAVERANRLAPGQSRVLPYVTSQLVASKAPVVAVSDYVRTLAESIRAYVPAPYVTLGTDGFGRSDTRASLRDFFEVDARWIAYTALTELSEFDPTRLHAAALALGVDLDKPMPTLV